MDIQLIRTFVEVIATGSFQLAAKRLFVTQAAVSMRIKRLEDEIGRPLFIRSKAGAELTSTGEQFERFARSIVKSWEDAKYHVAIPEGFEQTLIVGCQYSLWPKLGIPWVQSLHKNFPTLAVRGEVGMADRLVRFMLDGMLDIAVVYSPQLRPGFNVEPILEDTLVLASTDPNYPVELDERYILVDWGEEFLRAHKTHYPEINATPVTLALGSLSARYLIASEGAGYFPARTIEEFVGEGKLHIVGDAPAFPYPAYAVTYSDGENELLTSALTLLRETVDNIKIVESEVLEEAGVSEIDESLVTEIFN